MEGAWQYILIYLQCKKGINNENINQYSTVSGTHKHLHLFIDERLPLFSVIRHLDYAYHDNSLLGLSVIVWCTYDEPDFILPHGSEIQCLLNPESCSLSRMALLQWGKGHLTPHLYHFFTWQLLHCKKNLKYKHVLKCYFYVWLYISRKAVHLTRNWFMKEIDRIPIEGEIEIKW